MPAGRRTARRVLGDLSANQDMPTLGAQAITGGRRATLSTDRRASWMTITPRRKRDTGRVCTRKSAASPPGPNTPISTTTPLGVICLLQLISRAAPRRAGSPQRLPRIQNNRTMRHSSSSTGSGSSPGHPRASARTLR